MTIQPVWAFLLLAAQTAWAQNITVSDAWARATVSGQKATGAFMTLQAPQGGRLVAVNSSVAGVTEIHEMKMVDQVMKMSALPQGLALPPGQKVELKPGGYHIMLMDLKAPLAAHSELTLSLTFQDAQGQKSVQNVKVPVRAMSQPAAPAAGHSHSH
ncbi:MAG: hypothetical protein RIT26_462 [Pseudomonadota bacterium]|jgi:copper(I)-binding protein